MGRGRTNPVATRAATTLRKVYETPMPLRWLFIFFDLTRSWSTRVWRQNIADASDLAKRFQGQLNYSARTFAFSAANSCSVRRPSDFICPSSLILAIRSSLEATGSVGACCAWTRAAA